VDDPVQAPPRRAHEDPAILAVSLGSFDPNFLPQVPRNPSFPDENNNGCIRVNLVFSESAKTPCGLPVAFLLNLFDPLPAFSITKSPILIVVRLGFTDFSPGTTSAVRRIRSSKRSNHSTATATVPSPTTTISPSTTAATTTTATATRPTARKQHKSARRRK
jgi:hypothetical protein